MALVGAAKPLHPSAFDLRVITSDSGEATRQILQALRHRHPRLQSNANPRAWVTRKGPAVYLAIGPAALESALGADVGEPLLCLFTSNEAYTRLIAATPGRDKRSTVTAIYAESAPAHQMKLIRALYRRHVSVGVFLTSNTVHLEPLLRRAAKASDLELQVRTLVPGANVVRALSQIQSSRVLLAVPDPSLYTAETFRSILVATHRGSQAVIGFSAAAVRAGTLGAAYSTIEDTIAEVDGVARSLAAGQRAEARYAHYWRVAINENVARSLNILIDDSIRELGNPAP